MFLTLSWCLKRSIDSVFPFASSFPPQDLSHPISSQFSSSSPVTIDVPLGDMSQGLLGSNQLTTIDHSELSAQLGLGLGGGNILQRPQSPEHPLSATASPTSSLQDDDMDDFRRVRLRGLLTDLFLKLYRIHTKINYVKRSETPLSQI